jgi:hypothetical protein
MISKQLLRRLVWATCLTIVIWFGVNYYGRTNLPVDSSRVAVQQVNGGESARIELQRQNMKQNYLPDLVGGVLTLLVWIYYFGAYAKPYLKD